MMIYLTGGNTSLLKSADCPQTDTSKSLGGFISSSPVPNAALNSLFDIVSSYTLEKRQKETIALGIINQFDFPIKDVELKIVTDLDSVADFKIAAVSVDSNYNMEHISSRYQEPILADFFNANFYRASVDLEIKQYASEGEEIMLFPFNVSIEVEETGIEGTWEAFEEAFSNDETYGVKRVKENVFRICRRDESVLSEPIKCSLITTSGFNAEFLGDLENKADNTVLLIEELKPKQSIGIWIQRTIKPKKKNNNEKVLQNYKTGKINEIVEEVDMIFSYNLAERDNNYEKEQYDEQYS